MPAIKYSEDYKYAAEPQKELKRKSSYKTVPIKKVNLTTTKKTKKNVEAKRNLINFTLVALTGVLTILFIAIYSVVALCETKVAALHSRISDLNYENTDLENKLENVKSFYSVDNKVSSTSDFEKAKKVIEVNRVDAKILPHELPKNNLNTVTGF